MTIYFQGKPLPPLLARHVWGIKIYPGGRMELHQCKPRFLQLSIKDSVAALQNGRVVCVRLQDAVEVAQRWKALPLFAGPLTEQVAGGHVETLGAEVGDQLGD